MKMPPLSTSARDASEDISKEKDGGVKKIVVNKGSGLKPLCGDKVYVRYVGFLENGNNFTSNRNSGDGPFTFIIGKGEVMKAWEIALPTMQQGEKCVLYCHHSYAYGSSGLPPYIRPNTNCLFELELLLFEGEDVSKKRDGTVRKSTLQAGKGDEFPNEGAHCTVSYEIMLHAKEEVVLEKRSHVNIIVGDLDDVTRGVDRALRKMRTSEKARVVVASKHAYGSKGCERLEVPANSSLLCVLELHHFTNVKQHWELSRQELLQEAEEQKVRGSAFFKEGKIYQASKRYSRALLLVGAVHLRKHELHALNSFKNYQQPHNNKGNKDNSNPYIHKNNNISDNEVNIIDQNFKLDGFLDINENNFGDGSEVENATFSTLLPCVSNGEAVAEVEEMKEMLRSKEELRVQCLLNISACHLRMHKHLRALDAADQVLQVQPHNIKALYRRGMAHFHMANYAEAMQDFSVVLDIEPSNGVCARQARLCERSLQQSRQKDKEVFQGMFHKFALFDLQKGLEGGTAGRKDVFSDISEWHNTMADGMMTLEQEMEAFGESMPEAAMHHSDED